MKCCVFLIFLMTVLRCVTLKVRPSRTQIIGDRRNSGVSDYYFKIIHYDEHSSVLPPETAARAAGDEEDEEDGEEAVDDQLERLLQSRVTCHATCPLPRVPTCMPTW